MVRSSRQEPAAVHEDGPGTGFVGGLSRSQVLALKELRAALGERIQHPRFTDVLLLRFLRAQKFDVGATCGQLERHLAYRIEHGLDGPAPTFSLGPASAVFPEIEAMKRYYPHGFHKTDRLGRPIYIERLGRLDVSGLLKEVEPERLLRYFAYEAERQTTFRLPACSVACGRLLETTVSILDLDGLGLRTASNTNALRIVRSIMREQEENFPEITGNMLIVNAPAAFSMVWSMLKPILSASTAEKIEVFRSGQADYRKRLLELVAPENLPDFLGGTCVCAHCAGGCLGSDAGPWEDWTIAETMARTPFWEVLGRHMPGGLHTAGAVAQEEEEEEVVKRRLSVVLEDAAEEESSPTVPEDAVSSSSVPVEGGSGSLHNLQDTSTLGEESSAEPCAPPDAASGIRDPVEHSCAAQGALEEVVSGNAEESCAAQGALDEITAGTAEESPAPPNAAAGHADLAVEESCAAQRSLEEASGGAEESPAPPNSAAGSVGPAAEESRAAQGSLEDASGSAEESPAPPNIAAGTADLAVEERCAAQRSWEDGPGGAEESPAALLPHQPGRAPPKAAAVSAAVEERCAEQRSLEDGSGGAEDSSAPPDAADVNAAVEERCGAQRSLEDGPGGAEESPAPPNAAPGNEDLVEETGAAQSSLDDASGGTEESPAPLKVASGTADLVEQSCAAQHGLVDTSGGTGECPAWAAGSRERSPLGRTGHTSAQASNFPSPREPPGASSSERLEDGVAPQWVLSTTCLSGSEDTGLGLGSARSEPQCQVGQDQGNCSAGLGVEPQVSKTEPEVQIPWYRQAHEKDMVQWLRESAQAIGPYVTCGSRRA